MVSTEKRYCGTLCLLNCGSHVGTVVVELHFSQIRKRKTILPTHYIKGVIRVFLFSLMLHWRWMEFPCVWMKVEIPIYSWTVCHRDTACRQPFKVLGHCIRQNHMVAGCFFCFSHWLCLSNHDGTLCTKMVCVMEPTVWGRQTWKAACYITHNSMLFFTYVHTYNNAIHTVIDS